MLTNLPPNHPIWPLIHTITATACFAVLLLVTASSFDSTELTAISGGGLATLAVNYLFRPNKGA